MKKIKFYLIILFLLLFVRNNLFALDTLSIRYFPLRVGDFWVYSIYGAKSKLDTAYKTKPIVVQSFIRENHIYYIISNYLLGYPNGYGNSLLRTDSLSGSLRRYDSLNSCNYYFKEMLVDSLSAIFGDSVKNCAYDYKKCTKIDTVILFNISKIRKKFTYHFSTYIGTGLYWAQRDFYFTQDFGLSRFEYVWGAPGGYSGAVTMILLGCKLNGVVYGDTSLTFINKINSTIPTGYFLYQNYPNPFNPVTKIKFDIPSNGFPPGTFGNDRVVLKVYDILGKEITTLVNEALRPGSYEVTFDGSNLPSGVYFYQLRAREYSKIKKMILIK